MDQPSFFNRITLCVLPIYLAAAAFWVADYNSPAYAILYIAQIVSPGVALAGCWIALTHSDALRARWLAIVLAASISSICAATGLAILTGTGPRQVAVLICEVADIVAHFTAAGLLLAAVRIIFRLTNDRRKAGRFAPRGVQFLLVAYVGVSAGLTAGRYTDGGFFCALIITVLYTSLFICRSDRPATSIASVTPSQSAIV